MTTYIYFEVHRESLSTLSQSSFNSTNNTLSTGQSRMKRETSTWRFIISIPLPGYSLSGFRKAPAIIAISTAPKAKNNNLALTAALLTLGVSRVTTIGCYNSGYRYDNVLPGLDISDIVLANIEQFCDAQINSGGAVTLQYSRCYPLLTHSMEFEMKWIGSGQAISLRYDDCKSWFLKEFGG
jgi:hypothetical protein